MSLTETWISAMAHSRPLPIRALESLRFVTTRCECLWPDRAAIMGRFAACPWLLPHWLSSCCCLYYLPGKIILTSDRAIEFSFTEDQRQRAFAEGLRRQRYNELKHYAGRNYAPVAGASAQQMHLIGAAGEMAVAVYLGLEGFLYADQAPIKHSCDLPGIDVKTRSCHWYDLLVQIDDNPSKKFVLVTIQDQKTIIHGWIDGAAAMNESWIKAFQPGRSCYAVPRNQLKPIQELKWQINQK